MSERIRNIRDALRSGFDTQIAIGGKSLGLAEQRESRNFQLALEARRERLQKSMQTERLDAQERLQTERLDVQERLQEDRQTFELGENQSSMAFQSGQADKQAVRDMEARMADIEREDKLLKEKIERSLKQELLVEILKTQVRVEQEVSLIWKKIESKDKN